ncbi:MAG: Holliday junction resolvase RuvX [Kineosporiaceae bacterium]
MRPGVRVGVDVGSVRVGVARSDPSALVVTPVETVRRDAGRGRDLDRIARIVAESGAVEVVVGLPRTLRGNEGSAASAARQYATAIAQRVAPVGVRLVDERLSTVSAHRTLHEAGVRGRRHRPVVDQVAAVVILQSALDAERASGRPPGALVAPGQLPEGPATTGEEGDGT